MNEVNKCFSCIMNDYCLIRKYGNISSCPCIQCLVKPMCSDMCEERKEFRRYSKLFSTRLPNNKRIVK